MKTKESQLGQVSLRFIRSIAVNRAQTKHSARNRMLASSQIGSRTRLPPKQECYQLSKVELNCVRRVAGYRRRPRAEPKPLLYTKLLKWHKRPAPQHLNHAPSPPLLTPHT